MNEPLVSIGLPVYNGAQYLNEALKSLVSQSYQNFELIISDNASTDETEAICRDFAARDTRIRYLRNKANLGALKNFGLVFDLARGEYFLLAAHDDLFEPGYLGICVAALEDDPGKVLCCSSLRFIDEAGALIELDYDKYDNPDLSSLDVRQRVRTLLSRSGWYAIYGLVRADVFRKVNRSRVAYGGDVLILMELCLQGPFAKVPQILFWYRQFADRTEEDRAKQASEDTRPDYNRLIRGLIRIVRESQFGPVMKLLLIWDVLSVVHSRESAWKNRLGDSRLRSLISSLKPGGEWA